MLRQAQRDAKPTRGVGFDWPTATHSIQQLQRLNYHPDQFRVVLTSD